MKLSNQPQFPVASHKSNSSSPIADKEQDHTREAMVSCMSEEVSTLHSKLLGSDRLTQLERSVLQDMAREVYKEKDVSVGMHDTSESIDKNDFLKYLMAECQNKTAGDIGAGELDSFKNDLVKMVETNIEKWNQAFAGYKDSPPHTASWLDFAKQSAQGFLQSLLPWNNSPATVYDPKLAGEEAHKLKASLPQEEKALITHIRASLELNEAKDIMHKGSQGWAESLVMAMTWKGGVVGAPVVLSAPQLDQLTHLVAGSELGFEDLKNKFPNFYQLLSAEFHRAAAPTHNFLEIVGQRLPSALHHLSAQLHPGLPAIIETFQILWGIEQHGVSEEIKRQAVSQAISLLMLSDSKKDPSFQQAINGALDAMLAKAGIQPSQPMTLSGLLTSTLAQCIGIGREPVSKENTKAEKEQVSKFIREHAEKGFLAKTRTYQPEVSALKKLEYLQNVMYSAIKQGEAASPYALTGLNNYINSFFVSDKVIDVKPDVQPKIPPSNYQSVISDNIKERLDAYDDVEEINAEPDENIVGVKPTYAGRMLNSAVGAVVGAVVTGNPIGTIAGAILGGAGGMEGRPRPPLQQEPIGFFPERGKQEIAQSPDQKVLQPGEASTTSLTTANNLPHKKFVEQLLKDEIKEIAKYSNATPFVRPIINDELYHLYMQDYEAAFNSAEPSVQAIVQWVRERLDDLTNAPDEKVRKDKFFASTLMNKILSGELQLQGRNLTGNINSLYSQKTSQVLTEWRFPDQSKLTLQLASTATNVLNKTILSADPMVEKAYIKFMSAMHIAMQNPQAPEMQNLITEMRRYDRGFKTTTDDILIKTRGFQFSLKEKIWAGEMKLYGGEIYHGVNNDFTLMDKIANTSVENVISCQTTTNEPAMLNVVPCSIHEANITQLQLELSPENFIDALREKYGYLMGKKPMVEVIITEPGFAPIGKEIDLKEFLQGKYKYTPVVFPKLFSSELKGVLREYLLNTEQRQETLDIPDIGIELGKLANDVNAVGKHFNNTEINQRRLDVEKWVNENLLKVDYQPEFDRSETKTQTWLTGLLSDFKRISSEQWKQKITLENLMNSYGLNDTGDKGSNEIIAFKNALEAHLPVDDLLHLSPQDYGNILLIRYSDVIKQHADLLGVDITESLNNPSISLDGSKTIPNVFTSLKNYNEIRRDIEKYLDATPEVKKNSQARYDSVALKWIKKATDINEIFDKITNERINKLHLEISPGIPVTPETKIKLEAGLSSWLIDLINLRAGGKGGVPHKIAAVQTIDTDIKGLVSGKWRQKPIEEANFLYGISAVISHHTPVIKSVRFEGGPLMYPPEAKELAADILPDLETLNMLRLLDNPWSRGIIVREKMRTAYENIDNLLYQLSKGSMELPADVTDPEAVIRGLRQFRNGEQLPFVTFTGLSREGKLPIGDLIAVPVDGGNIFALISLKTSKAIFASHKEIESLKDSLVVDHARPALVEILTSHVDPQQNYDAIVRNENRMEKLLSDFETYARIYNPYPPIIRDKKNEIDFTKWSLWAKQPGIQGRIDDIKKDMLKFGEENYNKLVDNNKLRELVDKMDNSYEDYNVAMLKYMSFYPTEGVQVKLGVKSHQENDKSLYEKVSQESSLIWEALSFGRTLDLNSVSQSEIKKDQNKETLMFAISTAAALLTGAAVGIAGQIMKLSAMQTWALVTVAQAGEEATESALKAYFENNEEQRREIIRSIPGDFFLSVGGDVVMDKLLSSALKKIKNYVKLNAFPELKNILKNLDAININQLDKLDKQWMKVSPSDRLFLVVDSVLETDVAQGLLKTHSHKEVRQSIERAITDSRIINKDTSFASEFSMGMDAVNRFKPARQQYPLPPNVQYRVDENRIGDTNVYRVSDGVFIKDYPSSPDAGSDHDKVLEQVNKEVNAYNSVYGENSAEVINYFEKGKEKVSAKFSGLPGESLESLLESDNVMIFNIALHEMNNKDIDSMINEFVNALGSKGIYHPNLKLSDLNFDFASNKFKLNDFSKVDVSINGEVLPQDKIKKMYDRMQGVISQANQEKLLKIKDGITEKNRITAVEKEYNKQERVLWTSVKSKADFIKGQEEFLRKPILDASLATKLDDYAFMEYHELMSQCFINNPFKLTYKELGTLSKYIASVKNKADMVTEAYKANVLALKLGVNARRVSLSPQSLMTTNAGLGDSGRCRPLAYAMEVAYHNGYTEQMLNNFRQVIGKTDLAQAKLYVEALDDFHSQSSVGFETKITKETGDTFDTDEIAEYLKTVEKEASFSIRTSQHAMSAGIHFEGDNKIYHFYDPNVGIVEFTDFNSFKTALKRVPGDEQYGKVIFAFGESNKPEYRFYEIDTEKLSNTAIEKSRSSAWTIADFSKPMALQPGNADFITIEGKMHLAPTVSADACSIGPRAKRGICQAPNNFQYSKSLELGSIARPDIMNPNDIDNIIQLIDGINFKNHNGPLTLKNIKDALLALNANAKSNHGNNNFIPTNYSSEVKVFMDALSEKIKKLNKATTKQEQSKLAEEIVEVIWERTKLELYERLDNFNVGAIISLDKELSQSSTFSATKTSRADDLKLFLNSNNRRIDYIVEKDYFIEDGFKFSKTDTNANNEKLNKFAKKLDDIVNEIKTQKNRHPGKIITVHCGAGDGRSGMVKSAFEMENLYFKNSLKYKNHIQKQTKTERITTKMSTDFHPESNNNRVYTLVHEAINKIRNKHPHAVERPEDIKVLNKYAEYLVASYP